MGMISVTVYTFTGTSLRDNFWTQIRGNRPKSDTKFTPVFDQIRSNTKKWSYKFHSFCVKFGKIDKTKDISLFFLISKL